jgi:hypothetical protein
MSMYGAAFDDGLSYTGHVGVSNAASNPITGTIDISTAPESWGAWAI